MYFVSDKRINPATGDIDHYYRIKESFRDATGRVRTRLMLAVGLLRLCSEPTDQAAAIYSHLGYKSTPFQRHYIIRPDSAELKNL